MCMPPSSQSAAWMPPPAGPTWQWRRTTLPSGRSSAQPHCATMAQPGPSPPQCMARPPRRRRAGRCWRGSSAWPASSRRTLTQGCVSLVFTAEFPLRLTSQLDWPCQSHYSCGMLFGGLAVVNSQQAACSPQHAWSSIPSDGRQQGITLWDQQGSARICMPVQQVLLRGPVAALEPKECTQPNDAACANKLAGPWHACSSG